MIGIDRVPERLAFAAEKSGVEILDFAEHKDVVKCIQEMVPGGLDVAIDCGNKSNFFDRLALFTQTLL